LDGLVVPSIVHSFTMSLTKHDEAAMVQMLFRLGPSWGALERMARRGTSRTSTSEALWRRVAAATVSELNRWCVDSNGHSTGCNECHGLDCGRVLQRANAWNQHDLVAVRSTRDRIMEVIDKQIADRCGSIGIYCMETQTLGGKLFAEELVERFSFDRDRIRLYAPSKDSRDRPQKILDIDSGTVPI
jgi:hypothetical protein